MKCRRSSDPRKRPPCYYVIKTPFYYQKDFKNFVTNIIKYGIQYKISIIYQD